jgi:hypothetical protein
MKTNILLFLVVLTSGISEAQENEASPFLPEL